MADQIEQVGALERITPGKYHQRVAERADLVQQTITLFRAELARVACLHGGCPAMHAGQVAGLRYFPNDQQWRLIKVHGTSTCGDDNFAILWPAPVARGVRNRYLKPGG